MSASGEALATLVDTLAATCAPHPVVVAEASQDHRPGTGTVVRPLALERVGVVRRPDPALELRLVVELLVPAPRALDLLEGHLVTIERHAAADVLDAEQARGYPGSRGSTAIEPGAWAPQRALVAVRVVVPLDEERAPLVTQPPVVRLEVATGLASPGDDRPDPVLPRNRRAPRTKEQA